ncbi:hypothetical protein [Enterobacter roggenkampii]|uniref:hypothetical protein n=1 Tax=Enterobacter roggenkampii TaxID=1812935 RepID=UPI0032AF1BDC
MEWWLYSKQKDADVKMPTLAIVAVYVVAVVVGIILEIVNWPQNKHVTLFFFLPSVLLPLSLVTCLVFALKMIISTSVNYAETRKYIAKERAIRLKRFACQNITIAAWSVLSPVDQLALNMLKLEGEFPLAPKTPLKIEATEAFDQTPDEAVFSRLLAPMADKLKMSAYQLRQTYVWVRGGDANCVEDLRRVLGNLKLHSAQSGKIQFISECPDYSLIGDWIAASDKFIVNRLLIVVDMHGEDDDSKRMENACAFLFTNQYVHAEGEKPVYLYQPMSKITDVEETMPVYLDVGPVTAPKALWYSGLSRTEKYPLMQALDAKNAVMERLEMESSLGEKSEGYRWLALALAADAVKYAQGAQLVANSAMNKFSVTALSSQDTHVPETCRWDVWLLPFVNGVMTGLFLLFSLFFIMMITNKPGEMPSILVLATSIILSVLVPAVTGAFLSITSSNRAYRDMGY